MMGSADIVIVGGGAIGSCTAFSLLDDGFIGKVLVIERDPSYQFASSALAMGGVRQQYMSSLNIRMVQYSLQTFEGLPECDFRRRGYLFLGNASNWDKLKRRHDIQKSLGAECELVTVDDIRKMLPELRWDDLVGGLLGPKDGYVDVRATVGAFRRRALQAGVRYMADHVTAIERNVVHTQRSGKINADRIVITSGAWTGSLAETAGVRVPISPVPQQLFRCALPRTWDYEFPMTVDPGGLHWRSDGRQEIILAKTKTDASPGTSFDCNDQRFYDEFQPDLVQRVPEFRGAKLFSGWTGLYEMTPDHNGIIDRHRDFGWLYVAAGFSGHGLMMSPATGKLMSELIQTGKFETLDASALSLSRFDRNALFLDESLI